MVATGTAATCADRPPPAPDSSSHQVVEVAAPQAVVGPTARLGALRAQFPALGASPAPPPGAGVEVTLPSDAASPTLVRDTRSRVGVSVSLLGATKQRRAGTPELAIYRSAAPFGGDVLHRVTPAGDEDFVAYEHRPEQEVLRYKVELEGAAGLRLVEGTLEVLDVGGAPRLRVPPAQVFDVQGAHAASLAIEGCAVDRSPRAPWRRPTTPPGATSCTLVVRWSGVQYPLLVDPSWLTTAALKDARYFHQATSLANLNASTSTVNLVLITGGFSATGAALTSVEIYEPLTRTFSLTSSLNHARGAHTATPINDSPTGQILIAGGASQVTPGAPPEALTGLLSGAASLEIYDAVSGAFTSVQLPGGQVMTPRALHTATALVVPTVDGGVLGDSRILLAGGTGTATPAAQIYDATAGTLTTPIGGDMYVPRTAHAATLLASSAVLMTGGIDASGAFLALGETFCPTGACVSAVTDAFLPTTTSLTTARAFHTTSALNSPGTTDVLLIAGGISSLAAGPCQVLSSVETFQGGAFIGITATMQSPRAYHTATPLSPPFQLEFSPGVVGTSELLIVGGYDGTNDLSSAEAYFPTIPPLGVLGDGGPNPGCPLDAGTLTSAFQLVSPSNVPERHAAAVLVNGGGSTTAGNGVLVAGGVFGPIDGGFPDGSPTNIAELFFKTNGDPCSSDDECLTGHCANNVCCDTACVGNCFACVQSLQAAGGTDGTCGPIVNLYPVGIGCQGTIEAHYVCDGFGNQVAGPASRDCAPSECANGRCSSYCDNQTHPCASIGWCNFDAGAPDSGTGGSGTGGSAPDAGQGGSSSNAGTGGAASSATSSSSAGGGGGGSAASSSSSTSSSSSSSSSGATSSNSSSSGAAASSSSSSSSGVPADAGPLEKGTCEPKGTPKTGALCSDDSHCLPFGTADAGVCVDGFCCTGLCDGQCEACDLPGNEGTCLPVPSGPVHSGGLHPRTACAGGSTTCAGTCAGNATACVYPDGGKVDKTYDCTETAAGVVRTDYPCDSAGGDTPTKSDCNGFRCLNAHECRDTCTVDTDCVTNFICQAGTCKILTGALCDGHVTLREPVDAGGDQKCANHYACPLNAHACNTSCQAVQDCAPGYVCDDSNVCVSPLSAPSLPSCAVGATSGDRGPGERGLWLVGLAALAVAAGRRRRG